MPLQIFVWLGAVAAFAQTSAQAPPKGVIEGQVVSAATGEPLRKAQVVLRGADPRRTTPYMAVTDPGGGFVLRDVEKGNYRLSVDRAGFVRAEYGGRGVGRGGATITVDAGQKITGLVMKMTPQAVITGRVLDEDGDPVPGASVTILKYSYARGRRQLTPAGGGSTDDRGEYRLHSLQPGKYYVSASWHLAGAMPFRSGVNERAAPGPDGYAPTFYPRTPDAASAVALDAAPGVVLRNIDIMLSRAPTVQVSGVIVDPTGGGGGRNTMIMAVPRNNPGGMSMGGRQPSSIQDGKFLIRGLRPGSYMLTAERWENNRRVSGRLPIEVGDAPLEGLTVTMAPAINVSGRIRIEASENADLSRASVLLQARNDFSMMGAAGGRVRSDGTFVINNAGPDEYSVVLNGIPENCYLKAIRFGDEDALDRGLNLGRGAVAEIDILLSPAAGLIEAVVLDGKQQPAAGATVVAAPEGPRSEFVQFYKSGVTDPYGRVTLKGLAPGDYKLYAWEEVDANAWQDPEFRKMWEKSAERVTIRENSRESKQLTLLYSTN